MNTDDKYIKKNLILSFILLLFGSISGLILFNHFIISETYTGICIVNFKLSTLLSAVILMGFCFTPLIIGFSLIILLSLHEEKNEH